MTISPSRPAHPYSVLSGTRGHAAWPSMQRTTAARVDGSRTFLALPINDVCLAFAGMMDCLLN